MKKFLALFALLCCFGHVLANPQVQLTTSEGVIVLELYPEKAPVTVENFLKYVRDGHYNNTIFHRVIPGFMIQGGGFEPVSAARGDQKAVEGMRQKTARAPIRNEADNGLKNTTGTIAMARTNDPHSASSQFFINVADNDFLNYKNTSNWGYTVFGRVIKGMEVVQKIEHKPTGRVGPFSDVPTENIVLITATELPVSATK